MYLKVPHILLRRCYLLQAEPLHRFVQKLADFFYLAIQHLKNEYDRQASLIWCDRPSNATVIYRFLKFDGIGLKIASMAANILARDFKVPFSDYFSIDISANVHVRSVFGRLGLIAPDETVDQLIFRARGLHPEFPGILDLPVWEIGRNWCKPLKPKCGQ